MVPGKPSRLPLTESNAMPHGSCPTIIETPIGVLVIPEITETVLLSKLVTFRLSFAGSNAIKRGS